MDDSPRGKLLSAAARLFRQRGFERTTVREIAAAAGIQSGSLFHHFASKEDILKAVMIEVIRYNTARMEATLAAAPDTRARLRALIACELESIVGDTREAMLVLVRCWESLSKERQAEVLALRRAYEELWLAVLREAAARSLVRVDPFVLRRLLAGMVSWSNTWFDPRGPTSFDQLVDTILGMCLREPVTGEST
ncbi:MAG: TetR/AcrR family transcriptional regulator [Pseudomonadota bacterium]